MFSMLVRCGIIYFFLIFMLRLMGKRQIGELDIGDLVTTLLISELGAMPIDNPDIPLIYALLPIVIIVSTEILISTLKNKSEQLKIAFEGEPVFIIYKGRLLQDALRENRISLNELLSAARGAGVGDIREVEYCLVEQNGTLSVIKKGDSFRHPVLIDGEIKDRVIERMGIGKPFVLRALGGLDPREVFLMTVDDKGNADIIKKEGKKK